MGSLQILHPVYYDPLTYLMVTITILTVAALARYIPALRASRVDR
jgi:ABC-type lipoprotein release transport system permease subunit